LISGIVLAAGKSERMGSPKALLPFRGRTFLENILEAISGSRISEYVIVVGHHREEIERRLHLRSVVYNPNYEQGMTTSFQAGIRHLSPATDGAVLFLVDHPIVEPDLIDALVACSARDRIVLPVYNGRRGHPVLFGADVLREILLLPPARGANEVVRREPERVVEVSVDQPGILVDIDTPDQLKALFPI
jgi:molybdenum cofactor cytidylyltransferase